MIVRICMCDISLAISTKRTRILKGVVGGKLLGGLARRFGSCYTFARFNRL
jgi:hypothetical protein